MLFRQITLEGIRAGRVDLAFRRWDRPRVRAGGVLRTALGELTIRAVVPVTLEELGDEEAERAGFDSKAALVKMLNEKPLGQVFRIELGPLVPDTRIALRQSLPDEQEIGAILTRLERLDARAKTGAWTKAVLDLLQRHPGVRAGDLSGLVGQDKDDFKINVRKLKNLGLTESLGTGYRLSPRGEAVLEVLGEGG
ncbi:MAG: hypothetical protein KF813_14380 [Trueperaceae bacterium]|nr:hypothetical protein [Trueperaceae bacterium]